LNRKLPSRQQKRSEPGMLERLRVDKWLWAARFYKTRSLASEEIDKGRVQVNGVAVKPAKEIKIGDSVLIRSGTVSRTVVVIAISDKRGPAPDAALLYRETDASTELRLRTAELRRLAPEPALSLPQGRPTKRDRREIEKMHSQD
jgi:ribosome-associated heat shock protein Hsp15